MGSRPVGRRMGRGVAQGPAGLAGQPRTRRAARAPVKPGQVPDQVRWPPAAPPAAMMRARLPRRTAHRAGLGVNTAWPARPPSPAPTIGQYAIPEQMITPASRDNPHPHGGRIRVFPGIVLMVAAARRSHRLGCLPRDDGVSARPVTRAQGDTLNEGIATLATRTVRLAGAGVVRHPWRVIALWVVAAAAVILTSLACCRRPRTRAASCRRTTSPSGR